MGKTEKIVVLSVLLSVVLLFVWSLQGTGPKAQAGGDAASAAGFPEGRGVQDGGTRPLTRPEARSTDERGPDLNAREGGDAVVADAERLTLSEGPKMLISEVNPAAQTEEAPESPASVPEVRMQSGWDLLSTAGMEPTVDPGMLTMRPRDGATWESLAFDLYGDESKAALLRHHNEGMAVPGAMIFVPVKDDVGEAVDEQIVEVLAGESLWGVAARTLGDGARWREIFEANQDVLTDPDFVAPGTRLKVPVQR